MKKIFLVEDDPFLVDIYVTKLEEQGFQVEASRTGEEALKIIDKEKFDLIILDVMLPDMSGWDILEKINENKKTKNSKVIILSNKDPEKEKIDLNPKLEKYLVKINHTPNEIVNEIKNILF